MELDLEKYRTIFLEDAAENLAELSRALLDLEKDAASDDAIELAFRMAHSIKGMAASLDYGAVSELAHALEDRMAACRAAGGVGSQEMGLLFRGLEGLEAMVAVVRDSGEMPEPQPDLVALLAEPGADPKKVPGPPRRARPA